MLLKVAATAVKLVTMSRPSQRDQKDRGGEDDHVGDKKTLMERSTSWSTGLPSSLIFFTLFG